MNLQQTNLDPFKIFYLNKKEFEATYQEIFINEEYRVSISNSHPFIIDCGSNIGLSILYFKKLFPQSKILGFEPNPLNFEILKKNIEANRLSYVTILNLALGQKKGTATLFTPVQQGKTWACQGTTETDFLTEQDNVIKTKVSVDKLSSYIMQPVDLLKMDIEGSEGQVLEEIEPKFNLVNQIILEYHGLPKPYCAQNSFCKVLKILNKNYAKVFVAERKPLKSDGLIKSETSKIIRKIQKFKMEIYQKSGLLLFRIKNPYSFILRARNLRHVSNSK